MKWETVIGLEVHAELSTKSKIFCACTTAYGGGPNTHVCPVCAGMPGVLPVLNRSVVEYALRLGIALNCAITQHCKFDRKNYFYPDLPKAYQVSQLYAPICRDGHLDIELDGRKKTINIREIHMEEDAGKLVHDPKGADTFMDFNRCGVPLLEIVSQPDFRSAGEVLAYLEKLRETLLYLDVCDCKMQEGSIRADINLSVRREGDELGVRTETKNMNSFKAIGRAIEYETARQIEILEDGGQVVQETRRWDDEKLESYGMRSKENAQDYRYFPEPDLLPMEIDDSWLASVKANLPELAYQKRERYYREFGIPESEAAVLTVHKNICDLFEAVALQSGQPVEAAHLLTGEIMRLLNNANILPEDLSLDANKFSTLITLVTDGKINRSAYKETVEAVFTNNVDPESYIAEKGLLMINDDNAVIEAVHAVITENQDSAAEYNAGKEKVFGFLMGQVMKKLGGKGNPDMVKKTLTETLKGAKR
ncbi:MAG: Asp-tRNA(Asn)/Glu-tRNA(Gln) amidotransferase subunit GatB [Spirochaetaceae bacterium]|jgi:aspartyl-tRNA(Asn)/glutamyl-tRNA(Gln) amidotransferase subunit B|nr:Asp-tRNA(Asn)/Glu-tRNA(Gln) amidotransferase subunit GatB [Spirochaetaceae bacterium]